MKWLTEKEEAGQAVGSIVEMFAEDVDLDVVDAPDARSIIRSVEEESGSKIQLELFPDGRRWCRKNVNKASDHELPKPDINRRPKEKARLKSSLRPLWKVWSLPK